MYEEIKYKPLSPWAYFGYTLLFSLPIAGLILLIVFSLGAKNVNLRNYARSYFCMLLLVIILAAAIFLLSFLGVVGKETVTYLVKFIKNFKFL